MNLIYLDESGDTGMNLNDESQPMLVLCAMAVSEGNLQPLEKELKTVLDKTFPNWAQRENF